ncbi:hypothetical protein TU51_20465 [Bacillus cytotoxicus]|uniref:IS4 family transposase n=1 Tax=Bacillus cytotoxicus TaxID=580165 RepID=A0AAX2CHH8_9BACI|nr:hypothetical protein TU51_20465 [Bacillus cytotoxicus]SCL94303.1 Uncharacterized protein BCB44BAC_02352 [Bacillus cytotoxicus]SCN36998.1 Uncharacterized protein BC88300_02279 [Bacillus cytotoxicus]
MNMHPKQELSLFAEELYRYMSPTTLNQLAIEAGGMKRKRKCHGHHFLSLCVWLNQQIANRTLLWHPLNLISLRYLDYSYEIHQLLYFPLERVDILHSIILAELNRNNVHQ